MSHNSGCCNDACADNCRQHCDDDCKRCERGKRGKQGHRGHRGHRGHEGATGSTGSTGSTGATGSAFQQQTLEILGIISPAQLAVGTTDDWNPPGLSTASIVLAEAGGATTALSGLAAQPNGRVVLLTNRDNLGNITLLEESAGSAPANRFRFSASAVENWQLAPFQTAVLFYDTIIARWRVWSIFTETFPSVTVQTTLDVQGNFLTSGEITPAAIAGVINNYTPGGPAAIYNVIRQALTAAATITGLGAIGLGKRLILRNLSATFALTLAHEDAGSNPSNRFHLPGAVNLVIPPFGSQEVIYDDATIRWFVV